MKGPTPIMSSMLSATAPGSPRVRASSGCGALASGIAPSLIAWGSCVGGAGGCERFKQMPRHLPLVALLLCSAVAAAQLKDPANLTGEHEAPQSLADTLPIDHDAAALQQLLLKLRTRASLMLIVAHPDDEDGGMLTFESRGQGVRTAMLTLNRGEGGQNLMSSDFNDGLGLIRTQELLAEDRYTGVEQFFGTEVDFGFSKTKEETLAQWTHERVLYDAVRAVRLYRPLVLASVFVGGPTDGHGHHQVAGEIAQEVFLAAADPQSISGDGAAAVVTVEGVCAGAVFAGNRGRHVRLRDRQNGAHRLPQLRDRRGQPRRAAGDRADS